MVALVISGFICAVGAAMDRVPDAMGGQPMGWLLGAIFLSAGTICIEIRDASKGRA